MDKPHEEGLYPDPGGSGLQRYFDGTDWTEVCVPYPPRRSIGVAGVAVGVLIGLVAFAVLFGWR